MLLAPGPPLGGAPLGGAPFGGAPSGGAPLGGAPLGGAVFISWLSIDVPVDSSVVVDDCTFVWTVVFVPADDAVVKVLVDAGWHADNSKSADASMEQVRSFILVFILNICIEFARRRLTGAALV